MSSRNNQVILCRNINNAPDLSHVIDKTQSEMIDLCVANMVYSASDYSFIRAFDNIIQVQATYADCITASYICIIDRSLTSKAVFGWINKIRYVSDKCVEIEYTVDNWATWHDRLNQNYCYVERQHVQQDIYGANRQGEPIQIDTYKTNTYGEISARPDHFGAIFAEERTGEDTYVAPQYGEPDDEGLPHTLYERKFILQYQGLQTFSRLFGDYVVEGHGGSLLGCNMYHTTGDNQRLALSRPYNLDGYTPNNAKMLQSPFVIVKFSNNFGNINKLKPELFSSDSMRFNMISVFCGEGQTLCRPLDYAGMAENYEHALTINNYPQIPTPIDSYSTWMGQNKVLAQQQFGRDLQNTLLNTAFETGDYLSQMASKGKSSATPTRTLISGLLSASQGLYAYYNHPDNEPDSVIGRANACYTQMANTVNKYCFTMELQTIPADVAKRADDFLSRYGYAQNTVMKIDFSNPRFNFHYVKIGINEMAVEGAIPTEALMQINNAFRRGITIHQDNTMTTDLTRIDL